MSDARPVNQLTRRSALTFAAAALPALTQSGQAAQPAPHPVVHFEIGCRDRAKSERFFSGLFGWQIQESGPASNIDAGSGISGHMTSLGHEPFHYTIFYVEVDDVQAYLNKAEELGGKTLVPPIKIPTGTFAWFTDIDGNTIGLLKTR